MALLFRIKGYWPVGGPETTRVTDVNFEEKETRGGGNVKERGENGSSLPWSRPLVTKTWLRWEMKGGGGEGGLIVDFKGNQAETYVEAGF